MGSTIPNCESLAIANGAELCTTIEYNKIISHHPKIKILTPSEYDANPMQFDVGFSISSFEHDGLGRYGDPINPKADIEIMKNMKKTIRQNGLLFLSVPVGCDTLVWNTHRIYGKIRLPMLLNGWELIDSFGFSSKLFKKLTYYGADFIQPIFVLKNTF